MKIKEMKEKNLGTLKIDRLIRGDCLIRCRVIQVPLIFFYLCFRSLCLMYIKLMGKIKDYKHESSLTDPYLGVQSLLFLFV